MSAPQVEYHEHGREHREMSVFEQPYENWDEKSDLKEYARRRRAHFVGKLLLGFRVNREKKEGEQEKKGEGDLEKALQERQVALEGLHGKKLALENTRAEFAKRFEDFRQAEKVMGHALEPFTGEKRDILFGALDQELNPEKRDKKSLTEDDQRKFGEALAELDSRTAPDKQHGMHMAAYMYLKQERVLQAEDQLNGTREQALARETSLVDSETAVAKFLQSQPELARSLSEIVRDKKRTDDQKLRAIDGVLSKVNDPKQREAIEGYITALSAYTTDMPAFEKRIKAGELSLNREKDSIQSGPKLAELEQAINQLPDDAATRRTEESFRRHDVLPEDKNNLA